MTFASSSPAHRFLNKERGRLFFLSGLTLIGIAAGILYTTLWPSFHEFTIAIDHCARPFCDFGDCYHPMAQRILDRPLPVEGFFYSPFFAILLMPFTLLPLEPATWLWGSLNLPLSLILMAAPLVLTGFRRTFYALLGVALFLTCYPVLHNFKWGQVSVLMTVLILAAFWLAQRRKRVLAGFLLGLAVSIKFYPALFVFWFVLKLDWRTLCAFLLTCALLLGLLPAAVLGWDQTVAFYSALGENLASMAAGHGDINSQAARYVAWRWATVLGDSDKIERMFPAPLHAPLKSLGRNADRVEAAVAWLGFLVLLLNGLAALLAWRRAGEDGPLWFFSLASLSIPFIVATSWPHYFVFLPFIQIFILERLFGSVRSSIVRWLCTLLLWLPAVALVDIVFFHRVGNWRVYNGLGAIFVSTLLLNSLAWLVLLRKFKPVKAFRVS